MNTTDQISAYINSQPASKLADMQTINEIILDIKPESRLWFLDGKDDQGKVVSNPNIGYGSYTIRYANGTTKEFYEIGMSANTSGISIYIMGLDDKTYLPKIFGDKIGKATVTGYCIKFKAIKDINIETLKSAIQFGFEHHNH